LERRKIVRILIKRDKRKGEKRKKKSGERKGEVERTW